MLSSTDHVKVSEPKWQYRKNRYLLGHVRKGKKAVFCLFCLFFRFFNSWLESGSASVKRWNTETPTNGKNECEYEIIYWKKHSWSLWIWKWSSQLQLVFVVWGHPTHKALSHAPIARQRAYIPSYFLLLSTRYKFVNKITVAFYSLLRNGLS